MKVVHAAREMPQAVLKEAGTRGLKMDGWLQPVPGPAAKTAGPTLRAVVLWNMSLMGRQQETAYVR